MDFCLKLSTSIVGDFGLHHSYVVNDSVEKMCEL